MPIAIMTPVNECKSTSSILDIIDKGSGELLNVGAETKDEKGELVARQVVGYFVRGGGSGKKSEKKPLNLPTFFIAKALQYRQRLKVSKRR